MFVLVKLQLVV